MMRACVVFACTTLCAAAPRRFQSPTGACDVPPTTGGPRGCRAAAAAGNGWRRHVQRALLALDDAVVASAKTPVELRPPRCAPGKVRGQIQRQDGTTKVDTTTSREGAGATARTRLAAFAEDPVDRHARSALRRMDDGGLELVMVGDSLNAESVTALGCAGAPDGYDGAALRPLHAHVPFDKTPYTPEQWTVPKERGKVERDGLPIHAAADCCSAKPTVVVANIGIWYQCCEHNKPLNVSTYARDLAALAAFLEAVCANSHHVCLLRGTTAQSTFVRRTSTGTTATTRAARPTILVGASRRRRACRRAGATASCATCSRQRGAGQRTSSSFRWNIYRDLSWMRIPTPTARTTRSHRSTGNRSGGRSISRSGIGSRLSNRSTRLPKDGASSASRAWSFRIRASTGGRSSSRSRSLPPTPLGTSRPSGPSGRPLVRPALQFVPSPTVTARRASQPSAVGRQSRPRPRVRRPGHPLWRRPSRRGSDAAGGRPRLAPGSRRRTRRRGGRAACRRAAARRPPAPRRASTTGFRAHAICRSSTRTASATCLETKPCSSSATRRCIRPRRCLRTPSRAANASTGSPSACRISSRPPRGPSGAPVGTIMSRGWHRISQFLARDRTGRSSGPKRRMSPRFGTCRRACGASRGRFLRGKR
ncbi:unnamed protein product [Pelagomonas calceolata]|uniref:Uncharacterized protein n=1 Tax=Pelagomonas calceolata TaxID=35677 RepID=A0A8J2WXI7_9STRA|nr:unnamed protein product [Pelagomonas calceolata]